MTAAIQPTSIAGLEDTNRVKKQNGMRLGRPRGVGKSKLDAYRVEIEALLKLTVRLFWKLVRRFGSLVSKEIIMLKFDGVSLGHLTPGGHVGDQLSHKSRESHKWLKFNRLKFAKPRKK